MGLDMYAYAGKFTKDPEDPAAVIPIKGEVKIEDEIHEIFYWRKFNALHRKMEELYRSRGGNNKFNLIYIELFEEDLDKLLADVVLGLYKPMEGFFFGPQEVGQEDLESIKAFVALAKEELADGNQIVYQAWW